MNELTNVVADEITENAVEEAAKTGSGLGLGLGIAGSVMLVAGGAYLLWRKIKKSRAAKEAEAEVVKFASEEIE